MIWLLALLLAPQGATAPEFDPRIEWVELQRSGQYDDALRRVEDHLASTPAGRRAQGAHYLRGRLLSLQGRHEEAAAALAVALTTEPALGPWTRFRMAEAQVALDHPEVAAGLLATLLGSRPTDDLKQLATRLLATTIGQGGDCRLLGRLEGWDLQDPERRLLEFERSECAHSQGDASSQRTLIALLAEDTSDGAALSAAELLREVLPDPPPAVALDMAMTFFAQRDFQRAIDYFAVALAPGALSLPEDDLFERRYAVARSYFWLGRYDEAAERFATLAADARRPEQAASAYYQQARCRELGGDRRAAANLYHEALGADPEGSLSGSALGARLRLLWLDGQEDEALTLFRRLGRSRRWDAARVRAALFMAASDLVQGRSDRAPEWLDRAAAGRSTHGPELAYWQGRLAELSDQPERAIEHYRRALEEDPWDPWAVESRVRLAGARLAATTAQTVTGLMASARERDLLAALALSPDSAGGSEARRVLFALLTTRVTERDFIELSAVPTDVWPLWDAPRSAAEEQLLSVGDWQLGLPAAADHFPFSDDRLALTRARALAETGLARPSILAAEIVARRAPPDVPPALWPGELTRTLYPLAHGALILRHSKGLHFDPILLAAVIREESRFDAEAVSAAAARGLTQFVLPTARRLGRDLGLGELGPEDLHQPETAVRLGAAYLEELSGRFAGSEHQMLAAYNAGESQASLWRSYCLSDERAEYLTKVGFNETREYLRKVLRSRARYRDLYPRFGGGSAVATTPGSGPSTASK